MAELIYHFKLLMDCGYISPVPQRDGRAVISLEVRPYPGASPLTSARLMYEKASYAFEKAAEQSLRFHLNS
ncbi:hypothetical protein [Clostridium sp. AM58-1XD]|uniref:hypothetical protein n=1 Tax=Clostridium sp. AM58-1XD TaxID=2292307 RepID=UPI001FA8E89B|nr:hypothetical protein [Clostridium sp. AM58-1XD]